MIGFRELGADDWRSWRSMRRSARADAPEAFGSTLAEWSGSGDTEERWRTRLDAIAYHVVAELDGHMVGMVSATALDNGDVELFSLWVAPDARRKGVGGALVTWVTERAKQLGAARVLLDVRDANSNAIALYARHGFRDAGPASGPGDPHPERRMSLVLQGGEVNDALDGR